MMYVPKFIFNHHSPFFFYSSQGYSLNSDTIYRKSPSDYNINFNKRKIEIFDSFNFLLWFFPSNHIKKEITEILPCSDEADPIQLRNCFKCINKQLNLHPSSFFYYKTFDKINIPKLISERNEDKIATSLNASKVPARIKNRKVVIYNVIHLELLRTINLFTIVQFLNDF